MGLEMIRNVRKEHLPLIVLTDDLHPGRDKKGFAKIFSKVFWAGIKFHQLGSFTHAMTCWRIDEEKGPMVKSQELTLRERPLADFLKGRHFVRIWYNPRWQAETPEKVKALEEKIRRELRLPWWRRLYDAPGILGQAVGLARTLQVPWLDYCSESTGEDLEFLETGSGLKHADPREIDEWCIKNRGRKMYVFDQYDPNLVELVERGAIA